MDNTIIRLNLIDVTAKEDGTPSANGNQPFAPPEQLSENIVFVPQYATLEDDFFILDGSMELIPDNTEDMSFGWWSSVMSDGDGMFSEPPILNVTFSEQHTSAGLTLNFLNDYSDSVRAQWYDLAGNLISTIDVHPNGLRYFIDNPVENFGKIVISFFSSSSPYRYVKLRSIEYGVEKLFSGEDVIEASILEEVDPISAELSINTLSMKLHGPNGEFDLINPKGIYKLFQQAQEVSVTQQLDGQNIPMGSYFLSAWKSEDASNGSFTAIDAIGVLDKTIFKKGRIYNGDLAGQVISEIMEDAGWSKYTVDVNVQNQPLYGWLPICTHRAALQQVAFAVCGIVSDCRGDTIKIYRQVPAYRHLIGRSQKFSSSVTLLSYVSDVELTVHKYSLEGTANEIFKGTLDIGDHEIQFGTAVSELSVIGASLLEQYANYAIVRVSTAGEVILTGTQYIDQTTTYSLGAEKLPAGEYRNSVKADSATLVSWQNAAVVAQRMFWYYSMRYQTDAEIILSGQSAGEFVALQHSTGDAYTLSAIEKMNVNLSGGFVGTMTLIGDGMDVRLSYYAGEIYAGESIGVI